MQSSRQIHRKSWILSYSVSHPDVSMLMRETRADLLIDECYSTCEYGKRYVLFHFDSKLRKSVVDQALSECGATFDYELHGLETEPDSLSQMWLRIITRHNAVDDARLSAWVKPGRMRSLMSSVRGGGGGNVSRVEVVVASAGGSARNKRPRGGGGGVGGDDSGGEPSVSVEQQLLAEKDRQLAEKDARYEQALASMEAQYQRSLAEKDAYYAGVLTSKDEEMRILLVRCEQADQRVGETETKLASFMSGLRAAGGDASEREIVLDCDLKAEKKQVARLTAQLKDASSKLKLEVESNESVKAQLIDRIHNLELDIQSLRMEAQRWECDRERKTSALNDVTEKLSNATVKISKLQAAYESKDELASELRRRALDIIRAEITAECDNRTAQVQAMVATEKKEGLARVEKYKKRNSSLHRELDLAKARLRCFVAE